MALWSEPRASVNTQKVYSKIRRFIVIKYMQSHSICVPIHTYSGQATSKPGVNPADHAPLVKYNEEVVYHELEDKMAINKMPLSLIVEDLTINFNPYSRVCFSKPHTFQHNIKVRKIGRIAPEHLPRLIRYYRERVGVMDTDADDVEELMETEVEDMSGSMEVKSEDMEGLMDAETDHMEELIETKHDRSEGKGKQLQEKAKPSSFSE